MIAILLALAVADSAGAQANGNYILGQRGIKGATVPPEGFLFQQDFFWYTADSLKDDSGDTLPSSGDLDIYTGASTVTWSREMDLIGGTYSFLMMIPYANLAPQYHRLDLDQNQFGIGDIYVQPLQFGWKGECWEALVNAGLYIPSGRYSDRQLDNIGLGRWAGQLGGGGTVYFDSEKDWSLSVLANYELHADQKGIGITNGDNINLEWGLGWTPHPLVDIGAVGYATWQIKSDTGDDVVREGSRDRDRVYAAGPEVTIRIPSLNVEFTTRYNFEFKARNRTQGGMLTLSARVPLTFLNRWLSSL